MNTKSDLRPIPGYVGFHAPLDERYDAHGQGRVYRVGLKMNTPATCNWKCPYCYVGDPEQSDRPRQKLIYVQSENEPVPLHRDETWPARMMGWLDQAIELGLRAVTLNGTFEPTTSPHWKRIIEFCQERGVAVALVTNGGVLDDDDLDWIAASGINLLTKLNVPFTTADDPRYAEFARVQKILSGRAVAAERGYEEQMALVRRFIDRGMAEETAPGVTRLGVESVITGVNIAWLPELVAQLRAMNLYSHIEVTKLQGFARTNPDLIVTRAQIEGLMYQILEDDIASGYEPYDPKPPYVGGACYENLFRIDLHADGSIKPCPGIETKIGDLNETSLLEVIQSPALDIIRNLETHIEGDCKDCELFKSRQCYGGCRGTAYQSMALAGRSERERWVASDPSCWRVERVLDDGTLAADVFDLG